MFSMIKSQILKPFLQFTKNLSADQLDLSLVKGEGHLKHMELNEVALMNLLNLPSWLCLRKAHCSNISFKIRWTKLESCPVCLIIDQIDVVLEALEKPRPESELIFSSYRTGSGKYRLADKVVDGATVIINAVSIRFVSKAFHASVEVSRVTLVSKTPSWQNGSLNLTSLCLPKADAVLLFKQVSWDSVRVVADGVLSELSGIPVKLITNGGRIRLTLKKRLSDSSLVSSRFQFSLDDLLWVLTISQVEACIVFLRSLKHIIMLSNEQGKRFAASRAERQTSSWKRVVRSSSTVQVNQQLADKRHSSASRIFHQFDILETSYHFHLSRCEIHFCDETKNDVQLSCSPNGYIKVHVNGFGWDWYPYHVGITPLPQFTGSSDFYEARDSWLSNAPSYSSQVQPLRDTPGSSPPESSFDHFDSATFRPSILQNVVVLRIMDFDVSLVSFPNEPPDDNATTDRESDVNRLHAFGSDIPLNKNLFIGSDKSLHFLPPNVNTLTVELRSFYRSQLPNESISNAVTQVLPSVLFGQLKPMFLRFDCDTVIWLNTFLFSLHRHLEAFLKYQGLWSVEENSADRRCLHIRGEALMPRLIFPLRGAAFETRSDKNYVPLFAPDVLVLQADEVFIQLLVPPIPSHTFSTLNDVIWRDRCDLVFGDPRSSSATPHVSINMSKFTSLVDPLQIPPTVTAEMVRIWCLHCPHLWMEFLTVVDGSPLQSCRGTLNSRRVLYRQPFLESTPMTIWAAVSTPALLSSLRLDIIVDTSCPRNPLNSDPVETTTSRSTKPITFSFGVSSLNAKYDFVSFVPRNFPTALDQLIRLYDLFSQFALVSNQISLDILKIAGSNSGSAGKFDGSLLFKIDRHIELRLITLDVRTFPSTSPVQRNLSDPAQCGTNSVVQSPACTLNVQTPNPTLQRPCSFPTISSLQLQQHSDNLESHSCSASESCLDISTDSSSQTHSSVAENIENASIAGSQDDWINTYEVLFALGDTDTVRGSTVFHSAPSPESIPLLMHPVETGLEVFENSFGSVHQPADNLHPLVGSHASPDPSDTSRSQMCKQGPCTSVIYIHLLDLLLLSDFSPEEIRTWLNLGEVVVMHSDTTDEFGQLCAVPRGIFPLQTKYTWSIFLSFRRDILGNDISDTFWRNSCYVHAQLLTNWSLNLEAPVLGALMQWLSEVQHASTSYGLTPCFGSTSSVRYTEFLPSLIQTVVSLQGGHLDLCFAFPGDDSTFGCVCRTIHFDQGFTVSLDSDAVVRFIHSDDDSIVKSSSNSCQSSKANPNICYTTPILEQYKIENQLLRKKVQQLTTVISQLQIQLENLRQ